MYLTKLPEILKNMEIDGDFSCEGNDIESLENFPKSVGGAINLAWNRLRSLEGMNIEVVNAGEYPGESFDCKGNYLTDLKGGPKVVKGNYNCGENGLESLEGAPEKIEGNFYCSHNRLNSLIGGPIFVAKDFSAGYNHLESLEGLPKFIGGNLYLMAIHKKFTAQQIRAISDVKGKIELI